MNTIGFRSFSRSSLLEKIDSFKENPGKFVGGLKEIRIVSISDIEKGEDLRRTSDVEYQVKRTIYP